MRGTRAASALASGRSNGQPAQIVQATGWTQGQGPARGYLPAIGGNRDRMALLELVRNDPDCFAALEFAFTRPPGVPERRGDEDPWDSSPPKERPRRISDELVWLR